MSNRGDGCATVLGYGVGTLILILIMPFIRFWLSYFGGWLASLVIGESLSHALNLLFNTDHFTPQTIPWIAAALGWVGGYFKNVAKINTKG